MSAPHTHGFSLDTSGEVATDYNPLTRYRWSDLTPFAQGYVEALFADTDEPLRDAALAYKGGGVKAAIGFGFSDLAPEALARIIAECEAKAAALACPLTAEDGRVFWRKFMSKVVTCTLGDDGKVRVQ
jgi:hypothetical protein